jgi:hypothetical protein
MKNINVTTKKHLALFIVLLLAVSLFPMGLVSAADSTGTKVITLDPLFQNALVKITATQGTAAAQTIITQQAQFKSDIKTADAAGDKIASHQKKVELRLFMVTVVFQTFGQSVVVAVINNVDIALKAVLPQIAAAQAAGVNVIQSKQMADQAASLLTQAKAATDGVTALDFATLSGNSIQIIYTLIGNPASPSPSPTIQPSPSPSVQPGVTPQPTPKVTLPPVAANLWSTIEAPRPWDYVPTTPSQSACGSAGTTYDVGLGLTTNVYEAFSGAMVEASTV